jgi:hypothetical protein
MHSSVFAWAAIGVMVAGSAAKAALVVDQQGPTAPNGGYSPPVVQSFTPAVNNVAAVGVRVHGTGALTAGVTISLFADQALTQLLRTGTTPDVPRDTMGIVQWEPVLVVPEQLYFLNFELDDALTIGAFVSNDIETYPRGSILTGGGNLSFTYKDAVFTTYYDDTFIPEPTIGALLISASGLLMLRRRHCTA